VSPHDFPPAWGPSRYGYLVGARQAPEAIGRATAHARRRMRSGLAIRDSLASDLCPLSRFPPRTSLRTSREHRTLSPSVLGQRSGKRPLKASDLSGFTSVVGHGSLPCTGSTQEPHTIGMALMPCEESVNQ